MKLISLLVFTGVINAQCSQLRVRKEIRELSEGELREFTDAVNQMHQTRKPGFQSMSVYEYFTYIHNNNAHGVHSSPAFLPWHRYFIRLFEIELQRINPNVMLPYWDWSLDASEPHRSPVLSGRIMGGNGVGSNRCVRDGAFADWQMSYPDRHCLRRDYNNGNRLSSFSSPESILLDINTNQFSSFAMQFEIKHGRPHNAIGGRIGDFSYMYSPNDPLFFLHHAFVDLVWEKWQQRHPNSPYEGSRFGTRASSEDRLTGLGATVRDTLQTRNGFYCYTYPSYPRVITTRRTPQRIRASANTILSANPFTARNFETNNINSALSRVALQSSLSIAATEPNEFPLLKVPGNLTKEFIRDNNYNPREVHHVQNRERELVERLNQAAGFRSLSSVQDVINSFEESEKSDL
ncbi:hypothetical protein DSO57_1027412 [Entomophthora muscae]|uniref:Uncharacterized protein n=1 Tax=Entomophthora muscae TaxID=34485 RepID=A0ACC2U085_9FUNG|nr:hypothetical protein DSO57_1027412 [Entomophthora muscae]